MAFKRVVFDPEVILKSFMAAKGDLISASAADTPLILTVGVEGQVLTVVGANPSGLGWTAAGSGDFKADGSVPMTGDLDFAKHQAVGMALEVLATEPATPVTAQAYYNSVSKDVWINVPA